MNKTIRTQKRQFSARRAGVATAIALSLLTGSSASARSDSYPSRAVRVIVPLAPGSTMDILARAIGAELSVRLNQPFVIENKPSAGGTVAMAELARSNSDGYTIAFASQGNLVFNLSLYKSPGYDPKKDYTPISYVGSSSNVLVMAPSSKANSVDEFVQMARLKPDHYTFSSGGNGTSQHLSGVLLNKLANIELRHIPYRGAPAGIVAVMSGDVDAGFYNTPTVISLVQQGKLKALGVTSTSRSPLMPDVPAIAESNIPDYALSTWFGFIAPKDTPPAIVTKLSKELAAVLASPEISGKLQELGVDVAADASAEALWKQLNEDLSVWPDIIDTIGARVD